MPDISYPRWTVVRFKDDLQMLHVLHTAHGKAEQWLTDNSTRFSFKGMSSTDTTVTVCGILVAAPIPIERSEGFHE